MVTRKQKVPEILMPIWVIQHIEALAARDGWDPSNGDELLFVERFFNKNDFAASLHEDNITGVAQVNYKQDNDNGDYDEKID